MTLSVYILPVIDMRILTVEDVFAVRLGAYQHAAVRFAVDRDGSPRIAMFVPMGIAALLADLSVSAVLAVIRVDVAVIPLARVIDIVVACSYILFKLSAPSKLTTAFLSKPCVLPINSTKLHR